MRAIDTNIVVRLLADDEPDQVSRARRALAQGDIFLSLTVCLEAEWVLRSAYRKSPAQIADGLVEFAGIGGLEVERPDILAEAIAWFRDGMEFADALHLASAHGCDTMLSFDTDFAKAARRLGTIPVVAP